LTAIFGGGESDLTTTIENLRQISDNLRDLTEDAKRYPSNVIFGAPATSAGAYPMKHSALVAIPAILLASCSLKPPGMVKQQYLLDPRHLLLRQVAIGRRCGSARSTSPHVSRPQLRVAGSRLALRDRLLQRVSRPAVDDADQIQRRSTIEARQRQIARQLRQYLARMELQRRLVRFVSRPASGTAF